MRTILFMFVAALLGACSPQNTGRTPVESEAIEHVKDALADQMPARVKYDHDRSLFLRSVIDTRGWYSHVDWRDPGPFCCEDTLDAEGRRKYAVFNGHGLAHVMPTAAEIDTYDWGELLRIWRPSHGPLPHHDRYALAAKHPIEPTNCLMSRYKDACEKRNAEGVIAYQIVYFNSGNP